VFVGQGEGDGAAGEHDEGEGGVGGVEPVGAADEQPDFRVQSFDAAVADPVSRALTMSWCRSRMVRAAFTNWSAPKNPDRES